MSIFVIGLNYKTAPIALREKVYFAEDKIPLYLQDLLTRELASEAVLISTCNRSELYCETTSIEPVIDWFCKQTTLAADVIKTAIYTHSDEEAVAHIMQVACGLESMILGEPQILGQMKRAYSESCAALAVNSLFHRLFQQVFETAKEIRTTTSIGACPVSVASAAIHFANQFVPDFTQRRIALIGTGDMGSLLLRYLYANFNQRLVLINRKREKMIEEFFIPFENIYHIDQLEFALEHADVVFSATGSVTPIIDQEKMKKIMEIRKGRLIHLIDIAVPRDIDERVFDLPNVELYCIDDLKATIEKNLQGREHAALKAREMIKKKTKDFLVGTLSNDKVVHTIRAYRNQIEEMCAIELSKATQQLHQGMNPQYVLESFAYAFTQKLLHAPSVQLRQAAREGRVELLKFAKQLFAISDPEPEQL